MSRSRRLLPVVALVGLLALSGCVGLFGGGSVSDERLDEAPAGADAYDWSSDADAHVVVTEDARFRAVYRVNRSERDSLDVFRRSTFGGRSPIPVTALRYRYPNGTVVNGTEFDARGGSVTRTRDEVNVTLPAQASGTGQVAFSSSSTPKQFTLPAFVEGTYVVVLPENRRVGVPPFGSVSPGGHEVVRDEADRTVVRWTEPVTADSVAVRFYLERDLTVFGGLVAVSLVVGAGGALYYRRQIRRLRKQREELGLDVDVEDDSRDPPPGMG